MSNNQIDILTLAAEEMVENDRYLLKLVEQLPADLRPEYLAKVEASMADTARRVGELKNFGDNQTQNICN